MTGETAWTFGDDRAGVRPGPGRARGEGLPGAGRRGQRRSGCRSSASAAEQAAEHRRGVVRLLALALPDDTASRGRAGAHRDQAAADRRAVPDGGCRPGRLPAGRPRPAGRPSWESVWDEAAFAALRAPWRPGWSRSSPGPRRHAARARPLARGGRPAVRPGGDGPAARGRGHAAAGGPAHPPGLHRRGAPGPAPGLPAGSAAPPRPARGCRGRRPHGHGPGRPPAGGVPPPCRGAPGGPDADRGLTRVRWLLEELRVSLWAQDLGTSEPVSDARLRRALDDA